MRYFLGSIIAIPNNPELKVLDTSTEADSPHVNQIKHLSVEVRELPPRWNDRFIQDGGSRLLRIARRINDMGIEPEQALKRLEQESAPSFSFGTSFHTKFPGWSAGELKRSIESALAEGQALVLADN